MKQSMSRSRRGVSLLFETVGSGRKLPTCAALDAHNLPSVQRNGLSIGPSCPDEAILLLVSASSEDFRVVVFASVSSANERADPSALGDYMLPSASLPRSPFLWSARLQIASNLPLAAIFVGGIVSASCFRSRRRQCRCQHQPQPQERGGGEE